MNRVLRLLTMLCDRPQFAKACGDETIFRRLVALIVERFIVSVTDMDDDDKRQLRAVMSGRTEMACRVWWPPRVKRMHD
jgi:hypothetical protein